MNPEESGIDSNQWTPQDNSNRSLIDLGLNPISYGRIPQTMWRAAKKQDPSLKIAVAE
eukprot:Awhi_evm1s5158